jgi:hypothetical protein
VEPERDFQKIELTKLVPSIPDDRDFLYIPLPGSLPGSIDLRPFTGRTLDQFVGSCTAESTVNACELLQQRAGVVDNLSRLFLYYNTRAIEDRVGQEGAYLRDAIRSAHYHGICDDTTWPNERTMVDIEPSEAAKTEAATQLLMRYERVFHLDDNIERPVRSKVYPKIWSALAEGLPVIIAGRIGSQFRDMRGPVGESLYRGVGSGNSYIGNHAFLIVGYTPYYLIIENSWGPLWGDKGCAAMAYAALEDAFEVWAIRGFAGHAVTPPPGITLREVKRNYLSARIVPPQPLTTNIWMGAIINGVLYVNNDGAWEPWNGETYPTFKRDVTIGDEYEVVVAEGFDLAPYSGSDVYVAYGDNPMTWTLAKICTIPAF